MELGEKVDEITLEDNLGFSVLAEVTNTLQRELK